MSTESESVDFDGNVSDSTETLADALRKRKKESVDVEIKNDSSAKRRRYVLVYKEEDDLDSDGESEDVVKLVKEKSKLENLDVEKLKLSESDLVWGKVRSYPWWPGQVVDESNASKMAKKHFKKGRLLVAYFGDCSFAWNDVVKVKPFYEHFGKMVEQSSSVEFRDAVDCALEEVARRVEFGLSCGCVSEEGYMRVKSQKIVNAGVCEESSVRYGGDKLSDAVFFEPGKLVEYVKDLACFPSYEVTEKLQFVSRRAQVLAFQHWKGYFNFLEYEAFLMSVKPTVPEVSVLESNADDEMSFKRRKTSYKDDNDHEERFDFEDKTDGETKEETLSDFIAMKRSGSNSVKKMDGNSHLENKLKVECDKKIKNNQQTEDSAPQNSNEENILSVGDAKLEELAKKICSSDVMLSNYEDLDKFMNEIAYSNLDDDSKKASITDTSEPIYVNDSSDEQILLAIKNITDSGSKEQTVKDCSADSSAPIALILNFADPASVPSIEKLNKAFNPYGSVKESETKVMKKSARVVFNRREDAENAFSSAGKYSIFGPALLSYKLKYV